MKEQKDLRNRKYGAFKKMTRRFALAIATFILVIAPLNLPLTNLFPGGKTIVAEAIGVGLIGGATTNSDYSNGVLTVGIHGGSAVSLDIAKNYYAQVQLPSSLGHLLDHPNIREHMKLKYSIPAPLLGFIPIKGEVKGDNLIFDLDNNIAQGTVNIPLNLSLAGVYKFTFEIDLAALDIDIPHNTYEFKITVGDQQLDVGLLEFSQSRTTLQFEHEGTDDGKEEEVPVVGSAKTNATIVFLPSTSPPPVVDPTNPTEPYDPDPTDPTDPQDPPTGDTGHLTLDYVSSIDFGTQKIEGGKSIYESTVLRPFIQVTDRRRENTGWAVTASLSKFENEGIEGTLPGSVITLRDGAAISAGKSEAPHAYNNVQLYPDGDASWVLWADEDVGVGTWIDRWYPSTPEVTSNDNVLLEVPTGAATIGKHKAAITWTLTSAPGQ